MASLSTARIPVPNHPYPPPQPDLLVSQQLFSLGFQCRKVLTRVWNMLQAEGGQDRASAKCKQMTPANPGQLENVQPVPQGPEGTSSAVILLP